MFINLLLNNKQFTKYLAFGFIAVFIDYGALFISYTLLEVNYIIAVLCGFICGSTFQFFTYFFYTFNLSKNNIFFKRMLAFFLFTIIGITIGTLSILYFKTFLHSLYLSKTASLFITFFYSFLLNKYIVFNKNFRFCVPRNDDNTT
ncbi:MAG: hypothetical protein A6F72_00740 [Cycloclasticus sp. symbiont of Poecilosclerida sp. N]|nr:MAG: hypothetical protein A6F72_00740 [Cycloclasticus sp. symbiont of Poecilosclerida sp. N]